MSVSKQKLGLIVPALNTVMEAEFQLMAAGAMSVHTMRISNRSASNSPADREKHLQWMATQLPAAVMLLSHAEVDVICYGCAGGEVINEPEYGQKLSTEMQSKLGIPFITPMMAVIDALNAFGAKRLSVASPYAAWLNEKVKIFLEKSGVEILAIQGLNTQAHSKITPAQVSELVESVDQSGSQAVLISCTNFHTLEIIEPMEKKLGKPILTSNSASMWKMLRILNDNREIPGAGRLFQEA